MTRRARGARRYDPVTNPDPRPALAAVAWMMLPAVLWAAWLGGVM